MYYLLNCAELEKKNQNIRFITGIYNTGRGRKEVPAWNLNHQDKALVRSPAAKG